MSLKALTKSCDRKEEGILGHRGGRRILAISFGSTPEPKIQDHSQLTVLKEFLTCPLETMELALKRGTSHPGWICSPHNTEPLASWCLLIICLYLALERGTVGP